MYTKNLFLAAAVLFTLAQSLPTAIVPSENPFPAREPTIHFRPSTRSHSLLKRQTPACVGELQCQTNEFIFAISNAEFINRRNSGVNAAQLIYDSDGCSVPQPVADSLGIDKDAPFGYNFLNSCYRHDFGYRNFKAQERFTDGNREAIDDKFHDDMHAQCESQFSGFFDFGNRFSCKRVADVYFAFVRACGGDDCTLERAQEILEDALSIF